MDDVGEDGMRCYITYEEPKRKVNRTTPAYFRMMAAGFMIFGIHKIPGGLLTCSFKCVCGKTETLHMSVHEQGLIIDVAGILEELGSVGIKHLRDDGYTYEQIRQIRKAYI